MFQWDVIQNKLPEMKSKLEKISREAKMNKVTIEMAIEEYKKGQASLGKTAELASLGLVFQADEASSAVTSLINGGMRSLPKTHVRDHWSGWSVQGSDCGDSAAEDWDTVAGRCSP